MSIRSLEWADVDLDGARLTVSKAVEESKCGVRVKETKSAAGARTIFYSHVLPSMDRGAADKIEGVFAVDPPEKKQAK